MGRQWFSSDNRKRDANIMMNYDEAIKALENLKWNVSTNQIHAITGEYMLINDVYPEYCDNAIKALETAKKERELYQDLEKKVISLRELAEEGRFQHFYIAIIIDGIDGILDKMHKITELERELK